MYCGAGREQRRSCLLPHLAPSARRRHQTLQRCSSSAYWEQASDPHSSSLLFRQLARRGHQLASCAAHDTQRHPPHFRRLAQGQVDRRAVGSSQAGLVMTHSYPHQRAGTPVSDWNIGAGHAYLRVHAHHAAQSNCGSLNTRPSHSLTAIHRAALLVPETTMFWLI